MSNTAYGMERRSYEGRSRLERLALQTPDIVGAVPQFQFKEVHQAFAYSKWLKALGQRDLQLERILDTLRRKQTPWTMRDYAQAAASLAFRRERTAETRLTAASRPGFLRNESVKGPGRADIERRQREIARRLQLAYRRGASTTDLDFLHRALSRASLDLTAFEGSGRYQLIDSDVARATLKTSVSRALLKLLRDMDEWLSRLERLAKSAANRDHPVLDSRLIHGLAKIELLIEKGVLLGGHLTPLNALPPSLEERIKVLAAELALITRVERR